MDLQLVGKRALVSGSSSGIGEAIAVALAAEGASVVVHGRRADQASRVAASVRSSGGKVVVVLGDLRSDASAQGVAHEAVAAFGGIDILVNNAGAFPEKPWREASVDEWMDLYNQNVGSMVRLINLLTPGMKERGWGRVICLGSVVATMPFPTFAAYSATKSANVNVAINLAKELSGTGITSNAVSPGDIITPGSEIRWRAIAKGKGEEDDWDTIQRQIPKWAPNPTGRVGRAEDVADLVAFLASPRSSYINGTNVHIDGGLIPTMS
jgi:NAD(P)-dependent dehydrogenase (short-subunit alcohol dehydrogenase family)